MNSEPTNANSEETQEESIVDAAMQGKKPNFKTTMVLFGLACSLLSLCLYLDSDFGRLFDLMRPYYKDSKGPQNVFERQPILFELITLEQQFTSSVAKTEPARAYVGESLNDNQQRWSRYLSRREKVVSVYSAELKKLIQELDQLAVKYPKNHNIKLRQVIRRFELDFIPREECRWHIYSREKFGRSAAIQLPKMSTIEQHLEAIEAILEGPALVMCSQQQVDDIVRLTKQGATRPDFPQLIDAVVTMNTQLTSPILPLEVAQLLTTLGEELVNQGFQQIGNRTLTLARRFCTRWTQETGFVAPAVGAQNGLRLINNAWQRIAFAKKDLDLYFAAQRELKELDRIINTGSSYQLESPVKLGYLDYFLAPASGYKDADSSLNRSVDFSVWESFCFGCFAALSLIFCGLTFLSYRRNEHSGSTAHKPILLRELLQLTTFVVVPAALITMLAARFHAMTNIGINADNESAIPILVATSLVLCFLALFVLAFFIRVFTLTKFQVEYRLSRIGQFVFFGLGLSQCLVFGWLSTISSNFGANLVVLLIVVGLMFVALILWSKLLLMADQGPEFIADLRACEARLRMKALLIGIVIFSLLYLSAIRPRRIHLVTAYRNVLVESLANQKSDWAQGELSKFVQRIAKQAPDMPR